MTVLRIGYALLLLTVLGLDAFCGSILSAAATALLVLTPLVCALLHLRAAKKLRVRLDAPVNLEKGEAGTLRIRVENASALPVCLLGVRLRLTNLLTGQTAVRHYRLTALPKRTSVSEYRISSAHCGRIQLTAERCRLYDPFGLIGIRLGEPCGRGHDRAAEGLRAERLCFAGRELSGRQRELCARPDGIRSGRGLRPARIRARRQPAADALEAVQQARQAGRPGAVAPRAPFCTGVLGADADRLRRSSPTRRPMLSLRPAGRCWNPACSSPSAGTMRRSSSA